MNVTVTIQLGTDEFAADLAGNASQLADKILKGVGGDPATDTCTVAINDHGTAGPDPVASGPLLAAGAPSGGTEPETPSGEPVPKAATTAPADKK